MKICMGLLGAAIFVLGGCAEFDGQVEAPTNEFIKKLPESVLEIAAPFQDLNAVRVDTTDGCLVYRHVGPVETTFLPLRSKNGNPICTRQPEVPKAG